MFASKLLYRDLLASSHAFLCRLKPLAVLPHAFKSRWRWNSCTQCFADILSMSLLPRCELHAVNITTSIAPSSEWKHRKSQRLDRKSAHLSRHASFFPSPYARTAAVGSFIILIPLRASLTPASLMTSLCTLLALRPRFTGLPRNHAIYSRLHFRQHNKPIFLRSEQFHFSFALCYYLRFIVVYVERRSSPLYHQTYDISAVWHQTPYVLFWV